MTHVTQGKTTPTQSPQTAPLDRSNGTFTGLAPAFIGKPAKPIKRNTLKQEGFYKLPFVGSSRHAARFWCVPATGGYTGGRETGAAMAYSFLKFLRTSPRAQADFLLPRVIESFMVRFEQEGGCALIGMPYKKQSTAFAALEGQYYGFFGTVSRWLASSAICLGSDLDQLTEKDLLRRANAGLGFDEMAYLADINELLKKEQRARQQEKQEKQEKQGGKA